MSGTLDVTETIKKVFKIRVTFWDSQTSYIEINNTSSLRSMSVMRASKVIDCAKEKVLVNNEPTSPHHKSDGVHKDQLSIAC